MAVMLEWTMKMVDRMVLLHANPVKMACTFTGLYEGKIHRLILAKFHNHCTENAMISRLSQLSLRTLRIALFLWHEWSLWL